MTKMQTQSTLYKKTQEPSSFIRLKDSQALYGIAILLMVFHHLFCIPERLSYNYISIVGDYALGARLAYHGKLCVAIYAFISGYSFSIASKKNAVTQTSPRFRACVCYSARRMLRLYTKYWLVFVIYIPIGICFFNYKTTPFKLLLSLFIGIGVINAEWWYILQYLCFAITYPFLDLCTQYKTKKELCIKTGLSILIVAVCLIGASFALMHRGINVMQLSTPKMLVPYMCIFVIGYIIEKWQMFDALNAKVRGKTLAGIFLFIAVFVIRWFWVTTSPEEANPDILLCPILIFGLVLMLHSPVVEKRVLPFLCFWGKYSTFIWLIHTFWIYYYFQSITVLPRYSALVFIWAVILGLGNAVVLDWIYKYIGKLIGKRRGNTGLRH